MNRSTPDLPSITNTRSPPKPMSIESVMPSNHFILCHPLLLLPSIFPSIRIFSNESALRIRWPKYHNLCWRKFPHFDWWYCQFSGNSKVMGKTSLRGRDWVKRSLKYQMIFSALWFSYSFHKVFSPLQTNGDVRFGWKGRFYIFFVWESKWRCFPDFKPE